MQNEKSKEPTTQNEQKCTPSNTLKEVEDAITEDLEAPWEYKDVVYTSSITGAYVVPVLFIRHTTDVTTEQKMAIVESYDGRHSLDATKVFHNRLICNLEMLTAIWIRSEKKAEIESEMASILKTLKLEKDLKNE